MKHSSEYIETMGKLAPLLRQHRYYSLWNFDTLCGWCAFFWNRGTISYVIDEEGKARGVCLVKLFRRLEQFLEPFVHEPCGRYVMLDVMVADGPQTLGTICEDFTRRWGPQEIILWDRGKRTENGAPRMYTWERFQKLARRITKGGN